MVHIAKTPLSVLDRDPEQGRTSSGDGGHTLHMYVSLSSNPVERVAQIRPSLGLDQRSSVVASSTESMPFGCVSILEQYYLEHVGEK